MSNKKLSLVSCLSISVFAGVLIISALVYSGNTYLSGLADGWAMPQFIPNAKSPSYNQPKKPAQNDIRLVDVPSQNQINDFSEIVNQCENQVNENEVVFGSVSKITYHLPVDSRGRAYSEDAAYNEPYERGRSDFITCEIWVKPRNCNTFRQVIVTPSPFEAIEYITPNELNMKLIGICGLAEKAMASGVHFLAHTKRDSSIRPRSFFGSQLRDVQVVVAASLLDPALDLTNEDVLRMVVSY